MSYTEFSKDQLNKENLINDVDFIYDAKQFLFDREDYESDDKEDIYQEKDESTEERLARLNEEYKRKKNWGKKN